METENEKVCREGLAFFGKTNRLISHELKNILAIISETMGLLEELAALSEEGRQLTPERLRSMSDSIVEEVERANAVIRCMNRFAHSVDELFSDIDLKAAIALTIQLIRLNPFSKALRIELLACDSQVVYTSPFFLENLLYHAFHFALCAAAPDRHIKVALRSKGQGAEVEICGIAPAGLQSFPPRETESLAKTVGAQLSCDKSSGKIGIVLPQKMAPSAQEGGAAGIPRAGNN